jgi:hypothetical protein
MGLQAAISTKVDAVIAINPQMYWQFGDPIEARLTDTRARRTTEIADFEEGARDGRWTQQDLNGNPHHAATWLTGLRESGAKTLLLFAAGDDGIKFLKDRVSYRLSEESKTGAIKVVEIEGIDHQMYHEWKRPDVLSEMIDFLGAALL